MFNVSGMTPISSHQAGLYINKKHQTNCVGFKAQGTVDTKESRVIGQQTTKPRVRGVKFSGELRFYKASPWLAKYLMDVQERQFKQEFEIMGVLDDDPSDFGKQFGKQIVTLTGCVLTGDIVIMESDTNCDDEEEVVQFLAEKLVA